MIQDILRKQKEFFRSGGTLSVKTRKAYLKSLRSEIMRSENAIASALQEDLGKSATEAYMTETGMMLSEAGCAIRDIARWSRPKKVGTPLAQFPAKSRIIPEPYGNVLIMSPWNYPFLLCLSPLVSAVAAGNTAIVKPSAYSPASSSVIRKIIENVFPDEWVAVSEGGRETNAGLLDLKFDYIFFTGSKTVGRIVMEKASRHLTPVTLELGGKSPVIIDSSANIGIAAARTVFGKYLNCGQTCVAPDYVLVHESIADKFTEACKREILGMYGLSPLSNPYYGKIINRKHFDRLCRILDEVRDKCVFGGETDESRLKISPSIIRLGSVSSISEDSGAFRTGNRAAGENPGDVGPEKCPGIMQDEIFGPLMPVITYENLDEAVGYIDSRERPLAAYIFSENRKVKRELLQRLHFGGGCVNDTIIHLASENLPFGGVGESGMGHYHGKYGFDTFSHLKSIVDKPAWLDLPMRYQPYTREKLRLIRRFLK